MHILQHGIVQWYSNMFLLTYLDHLLVQPYKVPLNSILTHTSMQSTVNPQVCSLPQLVNYFGVHDSVSFLRANHSRATLINSTLFMC